MTWGEGGYEATVNGELITVPGKRYSWLYVVVFHGNVFKTFSAKKINKKLINK